MHKLYLVLRNLISKINLFAKIKAFLDANPQKARFIGVILLALVIPLTVVAALTIQNLRQHAGGGSVVNLTDQNRNILFSTSDPNVFIDLNLNSSPDWVLPSQRNVFNINNNLVTKAFAVSAGCTPPYSGYLGCLSADSALSGSACTGSCTADNGQTGQYCYLSTKVGNSCTDSSGLSGTCDNRGDCIASSVPAPVIISPTPIIRSSPTPTDIPISTPSPTPTTIRTSTPIPAVSSSPSTTAPNILRAIYIENKDTDGSTGGSAPIKITVNSASDIAHVPWRLNDLLPDQTQAPRTVQVTLIGDANAVSFATTLDFVQTGSTVPPPVSLPVSSTVNSIPNANLDLNGDGVVNCKDAKTLVSQFGQKGTNLSADLNSDGIVNQIDYNGLLRNRNYTPGDTTMCN